MSKFCVEGFNSAYFPDHKVDLLYIWYADRYRFKVKFNNTPALSNDLKTKVMEVLC